MREQEESAIGDKSISGAERMTRMGCELIKTAKFFGLKEDRKRRAKGGKPWKKGPA